MIITDFERPRYRTRCGLVATYKESRLDHLLHAISSQMFVDEYIEQVEASWALDGLEREDGIILTVACLEHQIVNGLGS
jgi:hypothetical protein